MTHDVRDLGPTTERRFAEAFAERALITKAAAAALIGLDEKTLDALSDAQVVRAVRKGAHRAYTERDLRAYLLEGPDVEPARPRNRPSPATPPKVVNFSERRRAKQPAQP